MAKALFQLAGGPLSFLKEIHLDLQLKGKHLEPLTYATEDSFDKTVVSVLNDLMEENAEDLNLQEIYHVWALVKCASLGPSLSIRAHCNKKVRVENSQRQIVERNCEGLIESSFSVAEADVVRVPGNYKIPTITLPLGEGGTEVTYEIKPPRIKEDIFLLDIFNEMGITKTILVDVRNNKEESMNYARHRMLLHLCKNGETVFTSFEERAELIKILNDQCSMSQIKELNNKIAEVSKYGVKFRSVVETCPECKSKVEVFLPLSAGLDLSNR